MSLEFPRIRITLEGIRQEMQHAFGSQCDEIKAIAEEEIRKVLDERMLRLYIAEEARKYIRQAISENMKDYFLMKEGAQAIRKQMQIELDEAIKFNDPRL